MPKDVTVSKLSKLQKRVLVYARQHMLAKEQKIEPCEYVILCFRAPPWLNEVLTKTLVKIFETRDHFGPLAEGRTAREDLDRYTWFFEEMVFAEGAIRQAAIAAGVKDRHHLTDLFRYAVPAMVRFMGEYVVHPWPDYDGGWLFKIGLKNEHGSAAEIRKDLVSLCGEDEINKTGLKIYDSPTYPINCSIPEMLRDLFGFPLREDGRIYALAFDPQAIGPSHYNSAQASLRRTCDRLAARGLIWEAAGQSHGLHRDFYERSSIGLTEAGVPVADALLQADAVKARTDLGLPHEPEGCQPCQ
jgi:hypothetical protein